MALPPFDPCLACMDRPEGPRCLGPDGRRDLVRLARGYLKQDHPEALRHGSTFECVFDLACNEPEEALAFVILANELAGTEEQRSYLAAGALETLLGRHGPLVIDRVLDEGRQSASFRRCLAGVWGHRAIDKRVRQRIDEFLAPPVFGKPRRPGRH
jgi:hypothetical protein